MKKYIAIAIAALSVSVLSAEDQARKEALERADVYDVSAGRPVQIAAKKTALPLVIYGESEGKSGTFIPSGYMGDSVALKMISTDFSAPISEDGKKQGVTALKISYNTKGAAGWAGIFWMTPANNWAKIKGAGYDLTQAKKLTFWMKGEKGGERIAAVKFGGIVGPFPDTDSGSIEGLKLKQEWTKYEIDLSGKDLRHIVGGFVFSVTRADNPRGATFYLDEIRYEGDPAPVQAAALTAPTQDSSIQPVSVQDETRFVFPFANAKATRNPEFRTKIQEVLDLAAKNPSAKIVVDGHTDNAGPKEVNQRLSLERARAVADFLQKSGIAASRISVSGHGPDRPISPESNNTPEGREANRRVEITLVAGK